MPRGVPLRHVGLVHGIVQVGQGLQVVRVAGEVFPQDGHGLFRFPAQGRTFGACDVRGDGIVHQQDGVAVTVGLLHVAPLSLDGQRVIGHPPVAGAAGAVVLHERLRLQAFRRDGRQHLHGGRVHARHAHHGRAVNVGTRLQVVLPAGGQQLQAAVQVVHGGVGLVMQVFVKQFLAEGILLQGVDGVVQAAAQVGDAGFLAGAVFGLAGDGLVQLQQRGAHGVGGHRGGLDGGRGGHSYGEEEYQGQYKGRYHGLYRVLSGSTNNILQRRGHHFGKQATMFGRADAYCLAEAKVSNKGENAKFLEPV